MNNRPSPYLAVVLLGIIGHLRTTQAYNMSLPSGQEARLIGHLAHTSLPECDLAVYHWEEHSGMAGEVAAILDPLPILLVDNKLWITSNVAVHNGHVMRYTKHAQKAARIMGDGDYWCSAWIILVSTLDQAEVALYDIRHRIRTHWAKGLHPKKIVYVSEQSVPEEILRRKELNSFHQGNVLYIFGEIEWKKQLLNVYKFLPFARRNNGELGDLKVFRFNVDKLQRYNKTHVNLLPTYMHDMKSTEVVLASLNSPESGFVLEKSVDLKLMEVLAERMNFRFAVKNSPDGIYGVLTENGTWNGMVGMVTNLQADFTIDASITFERLKAGEFSVCIRSDSFTFTTSMPKLLPQWLSIIRPFHGYLPWFLIIMSIIVIGLFIHLFNFFLRQKSMENIKMTRGLSYSLLTSLRMMLNDKPHVVSISISVNGFLTLVSFYYLFITTFYKSSFISHITKPSYTKPINSLDELVRSDYRWAIVGKGASEYRLFATSEAEVYQKIFQRLEFCSSVLECMERSSLGGFAYISWTRFQQDYISEYFITKDGEPLLIQARDVFNSPALEAFVLQPSSALKPVVDMICLRLFEVGIVDKWYADLKRDREVVGRANSKFQSNVQSARTRLTLHHLQTAFYIFFIGIFMGFLAFIGEKCVVVTNKAHKY